MHCKLWGLRIELASAKYNAMPAHILAITYQASESNKRFHPPASLEKISDWTANTSRLLLLRFKIPGIKK